MRAGRDGFADFLKMPVHGFGVCVGRDDPGVFPRSGQTAPNRKPVVARIADGEGWFPCAPKAWSASPHALHLETRFR